MTPAEALQKARYIVDKAGYMYLKDRLSNGEEQVWGHDEAQAACRALREIEKQLPMADRVIEILNLNAGVSLYTATGPMTCGDLAARVRAATLGVELKAEAKRA